MTTVTILLDQDGEYRVPAQNATEAGAYYTDDREDAVGTAINFMGYTSVKIRRVITHALYKYM